MTPMCFDCDARMVLKRHWRKGHYKHASFACAVCGKRKSEKVFAPADDLKVPLTPDELLLEFRTLWGAKHGGAAAPKLVGLKLERAAFTPTAIDVDYVQKRPALHLGRVVEWTVVRSALRAVTDRQVVTAIDVYHAIEVMDDAHHERLRRQAARYDAGADGAAFVETMLNRDAQRSTDNVPDAIADGAPDLVAESVPSLELAAVAVAAGAENGVKCDEGDRTDNAPTADAPVSWAYKPLYVMVDGTRRGKAVSVEQGVAGSIRAYGVEFDNRPGVIERVVWNRTTPIDDDADGVEASPATAPDGAAAALSVGDIVLLDGAIKGTIRYIKAGKYGVYKLGSGVTHYYSRDRLTLVSSGAAPGAPTDGAGEGARVVSVAPLATAPTVPAPPFDDDAYFRSIVGDDEDADPVIDDAPIVTVPAMPTKPGVALRNEGGRLKHGLDTGHVGSDGYPLHTGDMVMMTDGGYGFVRDWDDQQVAVFLRPAEIMVYVEASTLRQYSFDGRARVTPPDAGPTETPTPTGAPERTADPERPAVARQSPTVPASRERERSGAPNSAIPTRQCAVCGKPLAQRRADARTCSDVCRKRYSRRKDEARESYLYARSGIVALAGLARYTDLHDSLAEKLRQLRGEIDAAEREMIAASVPMF